MTAACSGKLPSIPFQNTNTFYKKVMSHLPTVTHLSSLLPMRGPSPVARVGVPGAPPLLKDINLMCPPRGMQHASPRLACAVSPQLRLAGLLFPRYWTFQVALGHTFGWKTEELIQGRLERQRWSLEPEAGGASGRQGFRVVLATQVGGGSSHNPPPGRGGGN